MYFLMIGSSDLYHADFYKDEFRKGGGDISLASVCKDGASGHLMFSA